MKLSIFVLPALAFGGNFGRRFNQQIAEIDYLDATFQELSNMIDLEDAGFDLEDGEFFADEEELSRSSRDLTGWNRNINHGLQLATRNRSNQSVPGLANRMNFMIRQGMFSREEFIQALVEIKKQRRMDALRKLGY